MWLNQGNWNGTLAENYTGIKTFKVISIHKCGILETCLCGKLLWRTAPHRTFVLIVERVYAEEPTKDIKLHPDKNTVHATVLKNLFVVEILD